MESSSEAGSGSGATDASGTGDSGACGVMANPDGACPDVCESCEETTCVLDCNFATGACSGDSVVCPPGWDCWIDCKARDACQDAVLDCSLAENCTFNCNGQDACQRATLTCPAGGGTCFADCLGAGACIDSAMGCGPGPCTAECGGAGAALTIDCDGSCACTGECVP